MLLYVKASMLCILSPDALKSLIDILSKKTSMSCGCPRSQGRSVRGVGNDIGHSFAAVGYNC